MESNFSDVLFAKSQALNLAAQLNKLSHELYMTSYDCFNLATIEKEMLKVIDSLDYLKCYYDIAMNEPPSDAFKNVC